MTKFIPYEKLSKKQQREADKKRRGDWGVINPVTRRAEKSTAYNRKKARAVGERPRCRRFFNGFTRKPHSLFDKPL